MSGPTDPFPDVVLAPAQLLTPPVPVQLVAFVELQVSVAESPLATDVGDADKVTVGAAAVEPVTVTVADVGVLVTPVVPKQVRV